MMTEVQQAATGALIVPFGILALAFTALLHMYSVIASVAQFDQYKEKKMVVVACAMFFSFGFAVYAFVSSARIRGLAVLGFGLLGLTCYGVGRQMLPPKIPQLQPPAVLSEVKRTQPDPQKYQAISEAYQLRFNQLLIQQNKAHDALQNKLTEHDQQALAERNALQKEFDDKIRQLLEETRQNTPQP